MRNHRETREPHEQDQSPDECIGACFTQYSSTQTHVRHVSQSDALKTRSHALPRAEFAWSRNFKFGIIDQKSLDSSIKVTKSAQTMASISTDLFDIKSSERGLQMCTEYSIYLEVTLDKSGGFESTRSVLTSWHRWHIEPCKQNPGRFPNFSLFLASDANAKQHGLLYQRHDYCPLFMRP